MLALLFENPSECPSDCSSICAAGEHTTIAPQEAAEGAKKAVKATTAKTVISTSTTAAGAPPKVQLSAGKSVDRHTQR